jgi:hypothetical protein
MYCPSKSSSGSACATTARAARLDPSEAVVVVDGGDDQRGVTLVVVIRVAPRHERRVFVVGSLALRGNRGLRKHSVTSAVLRSNAPRSRRG